MSGIETQRPIEKAFRRSQDIQEYITNKGKLEAGRRIQSKVACFKANCKGREKANSEKVVGYQVGSHILNIVHLLASPDVHLVEMVSHAL